MINNLDKKFILSSFLFLFSICVYSQNKEDSLKSKVKDLDHLVITGQYSLQSVDKSIYQVEVISQQDIRNRAASTVADILSYNLNFTETTSSKSGDSQASLFGLDNQYYKVLIDNVPLVSDNGLGRSVDLSKINLDNVEQIEIVRGSMGVDYGSNTLTGLINIITKKRSSSKWKISGYVQEETVGKEYDWKEQGRHIQSLNVSHNISDKWSVTLGANRNDFKGYLGDLNGKRAITDRGYEWLPKEQLNLNGLVNYRSKKFNAFYKFQYLNEMVNLYRSNILYAPLSENGLYTYSSQDRDYKTDRWLNHLFLNATLFNQIDYKGDFSYQKQERNYRDYTYDIGNRKVFGSKAPYSKYASTDVWYNRGTFSRLINSDIANLQIGYEFSFVEGYRSSGSNAIGGSDTGYGFDDNLKKHMDNYDVFITSELFGQSAFSIKPGFRASFNTQFENLYSYSLAMKYELSKNSIIRAEVASSNRTPNYDELYTYFVDSNHNVQGNKDLSPEKGYSTSIHWNQKLTTKGDFKGELDLSTLYTSLTDKIELLAINLLPLEYKYINVDKYKNWGFMFGSRFAYKNVNLNLGASYIGISRSMADKVNGIEKAVPNNDFRYTFQLNSNLNYRIKKWGTTLSLYYKYHGKETGYVLNNISDTYSLGRQSDFSLLDASIRKSLFKDAIELTIGARNIFDVKKVKNTLSNTGAHQESASSINLFYGRSYFAKLGFNINI
ncbi:TonB-dependent receptor [Apibacter raozihei]|uniref:TonB-dependent receptor plug domain-containing protein n=1 Tax=Apibacter raozihei TaxID=2500547 RepID=UPI000FE3AE6D|nr:TonB-dependent receptor plug domain-containing protein [Apibacter raozihei]